VNQTLGRSVLTSGLTFIAVLCLYLFGGEVLRGFAFALVVGVVVGSYSTIFIASPIVLWWRNNMKVRGRSGAAARARGRA
jgi:preprotein translocase subunit SecF